MPKTKDKKKEKKLPEYHGMERVTKKKHKQAVDGLLAVLRDLERVTGGTEVNVYGRLTEATYEGGGKPKKINIWKIAEISFFTKSATGGAGCSFMASDAACAAVVYAAEKYLESFHEKPQFHASGEVAFDFKAESECDLRYLWRMPDAEKMREVITFLHWRATVTPDIFLAGVVTEKMFGPYGKTVLVEMTNIAMSSEADAAKLIARFVKGHPELFPVPPTQEQLAVLNPDQPDDAASEAAAS